MADDNLARSRDGVPEFFADDDPLAELARIVGYDERLVPRPPVTERREPAFNLEDELLREFERYDSPRAHQAANRLEPSALAGAPVEPVPVLDEAALSSSLEPIETAEPEWLAANDQVPAEPQQFAEEAMAADVDLQVDSEVLRSHPEFSQLDEATDFDLADELELTLGETPFRAVEASPQVAQPEPTRTRGYTPGFRMPLANFNVVRDVQPVAPTGVEVLPEPAAAPAVDEARQEAVATLPADASFDAQAPLDIKPSVPVAEGEARLVAPEPEMVPQAVAADEVAVSEDLSALDALIDDVSRYPVPEGLLSAPMPPAADAQERRAEPTRHDEAVALESSFGSLDGAEASPQSAEPAVVNELSIDDDFELALEDLEFDLSDILLDDEHAMFEEPKPAAPVASTLAPQTAVAPAPVKHTASWSPIARAAPQPIAPEPSVARAPDPVAAVAATADMTEVDDLPFDPAMITDGEEHPEPVVHLDVPDLHIEEEEPVAPQRNDYDFDLDGELASLLRGSPALDPASEEPGPAADGTAHQAAPAAAYPDLDDFERALEEDFRRSLTAPLPPQEAYSDFEEPAHDRMPARDRRRLSSMAVPLAVAGVVIIGGSIGYAFFSGDGSSVAGSGEPIVIAADTDPVKVLPENPGGKTVPNQDKAVYDRVAGAAVEAPKQEALISTSEEPVDVVQRTLMTDSLPLEGQEVAAADEDLAPGLMREDRLLPGEEGVAQQPSAADQQAVAVMPRRVKTMIVRPDGTLVEQEQPVESAVVSEPMASPDANKLPAASVKTVEVAAVPDTAVAVAPAENSVGAAGIVPASAPVADTSTITDVAADAPAAPAMAAPVPTMRPAQQPVDVVAAVSDRGNVQPTQEPAAAAPAEQVAAVAPGDYVIQIASLPSEADAQKSYQNLSAKFGSVIGGRGVDIKKAEIAGKGTFYRVRIPAGSKNDAVALCEKYRAAGGSCLVAK